MIKKLNSIINSSIRLKKKLLNDQKKLYQIIEAADSCTSSIKSGGKIIFAGNRGTVAKYCDCIRVDSNKTARVQEIHIMIGHMICELVEKKLFP